MPKKRKLNSKNPKYWPKSKTEKPIIERRTKICNVPLRNASGKKTGDTVRAWGVFYKD